MQHDFVAIAHAKGTIAQAGAWDFEPTEAFDLRVASLYVAKIAGNILARQDAEPPLPQVLAPVVLGRLLDPADDPVPALRIHRVFSPGFLDLVRAHGSDAVPQSYPAFVLAPDSGALRLGDHVDVSLVARWLLEYGRQTNIAMLAPRGRPSSAALTWSRSGGVLKIRLDKAAPGLEQLDMYRVGHGRVRTLLDSVGRSREATIGRLETMLHVGERLHAEMSRIGLLKPVPRVSRSADLERAIDEIEAGKTLGHVDCVAGSRALN